MKSIVATIVLLVAVGAAAQDYSYATRVRGYAALNGVPQSKIGPASGGDRCVIVVDASGGGRVDWRIEGVPAPTMETLPDVATAEAAIAAQAAAKETARQTAKPLERKVLENQFYTLISGLLAAVSDPRAADPDVPKLGFDEITALIEVQEVTDAMGAIKTSVRLLTIDAALKRYDTLWWEDAIVHDLGE